MTNVQLVRRSSNHNTAENTILLTIFHDIVSSENWCAPFTLIYISTKSVRNEEVIKEIRRLVNCILLKPMFIIAT